MTGRAAVEVSGPVPPGRTSIGYKYRVPVRNGQPSFDIQLDSPVALLNVLIADVGLSVKSERLHVRRPFRQGTRTYLHRQAYQVAADERVEVGFRELERVSFSRVAAIGAGLSLMAVAALFLVAPLRRTDGGEDSQKAQRSILLDERERIYDSIGDVDHDFETGKLDQDEYERMRRELRAEAVSLLRQERGETQAEPAPAETPSAGDASPTCSSCGVPAEPTWQFCARCGHTLVARAGAAE